jgi:hypothetical protein
MRGIAAFIGETVRLAYFPDEPEDVRHQVSMQVEERIVRLEVAVSRLERVVTQAVHLLRRLPR